MHYYVIETMPFGENCYIVYDEDSKQCMIVDPGGSMDKIKAFIQNKGLSPKYVILTHAHIDHIAVLRQVLSEYEGISLVVSKKEQKVLKNAVYNLTQKYNVENMVFEADTLVDETDILKIGENEVRFMMTSGHTTGSMCIIFDDIIITGDTLFAGSIGRTDLPTGSYDEIELSLEKLKTLSDDMIVLPGHGASTTIGYEKQHNPFMKNYN